LKASLRRNGDGEILSHLNSRHSSKAYQCGRLTAQLIRFQQWVDKTKAPNQHRLFGLALAAPKTTLEPSIWTSLQGLERLTTKRPGLKPRMLIRFLKTCDGMGADLPQHFPLQDQVYFTLGYYQQFAFDSIQNLEEDADEEITTTEATGH
jgi:CRISPR-associated protein (Cas_Csd1)